VDRDEMWRTVEQERLGLADLLADLPAADWSGPTLCDGWTVKELAAHLTAAPRYTLTSMLSDVVRARGNFDRMMRDAAVRHAASRTPEQLVGELRAVAASRRHPPVVSATEPLLDVLVHGQDLAIPLGRPREMPLEAARVATARAWTVGFPFHTPRKLRGLRFVATDADWSTGEGPEVRAPIAALLLLATGRPAALPRLDGPGAAEVRARLGAPG
jgi:uncharacterized protein (TIGR03083 family)